MTNHNQREASDAVPKHPEQVVGPVSQLRSEISKRTGQLLRAGADLPALLRLPEQAGPDTRDQQLATSVHSALSRINSEARPTLLRWMSLHVLECPTVRRHLRVKLLDWLTSEGVFRKLNDLREPSGCAVGLLTTSTLLDAGQDARQLPSLIEHCLSEGYLRPPNASDAMVLMLMQSDGKLARLLELTKDGVLYELLSFASWVHELAGQGTPSPPEWNGVSREWFEARVWRGPRRKWARRRGRAAGRSRRLQLEPWMLPAKHDDGEEHQLLPESFGAMIVEWSLAAARFWPADGPGGGVAAGQDFERTAELRAEVHSILDLCINASALDEWLESGLRGIAWAEGAVGMVQRGFDRDPRSGR